MRDHDFGNYCVTYTNDHKSYEYEVSLIAEDWLEMEGIWVERTLEEVELVMKLACSNEVADRDDC
ncbi:hypothetical protein YC2023_017528 [Brassica napus]